MCDLAHSSTCIRGCDATHSSPGRQCNSCALAASRGYGRLWSPVVSAAQHFYVDSQTGLRVATARDRGLVLLSVAGHVPPKRERGAVLCDGEVDSARPPSVCSATNGALPQPFAYAGSPTRPHIRARPTGGGRVPVTARLSKRFYDVFGEEIATELVDWFNQVDETYRADLRELNELNFARFDAKHEQRLAELRAELVKELADVKSGLKWMLTFWAPTALAVIGSAAGVLSLLLRR